MQKGFRVAILFNIVIFTEFVIYSLEKEFSSLSADCQFESAKYPSRAKCTERCDKFKGVFIPGTTELVCFHHSEKASLTDFIDRETKKKLCGYKADGVISRACSPIITCEFGTDVECSKKCSKYTVYFRQPKKTFVTVLYCGETLKMELPRNIDSQTTQLRQTREDGTDKNGVICSCGIGEEGKQLPEEIQLRNPRQYTPNKDAPGEMTVSCPLVMLRYSKKQCEMSCGHLEGIYSREDDEFICFQSGWEVSLSKSTAEYCECAVTLKRRLRPNVSDGKCPRKIQLNNPGEEMDCPKKCAEYTAYVFSPGPKKLDIIYCELESYIFNNLNYEIGKTKVVVSNGNRKHREYECTCGLRLSRSEIKSKVNTFLMNDGRNEVKNTLQISNHSDVRGEEREVSDSQTFERSNILENEEIDGSIENSDFFYDSIHDGENLINNNDESVTPIVGRKRASHQLSPSVGDEIDRDKRKETRITRNFEIVHSADLEMPSRSVPQPASPNNTLIARSSSSHNVGLNRNITQNDRDMFGDTFGKANSPQIQNTHLSFSILQGREVGQGMSRNGNTLREMHVGPIIPPSIRNEDNILSRNLFLDSMNWLFPNATMETFTRPVVGDYDPPSTMETLTRPVVGDYDPPSTMETFTRTVVGDYDPTSTTRHHSQLVNNAFANINEEIASLSRNTGRTLQNVGVGSSISESRGLSYNTSQNMGPFHGNMMRSNDDNALRDIAAGTQYPSIRDEDNNISHKLYSDSSHFPNPNAMMERNEFIEPVGNIYASKKSGHQAPLLNNNYYYEDSASFPEITGLYGGDGSYWTQNTGLIRNTSPNNMGLIDRNTMPSNSYITLRDVSAETRYSRLSDEDNIAHRSSSDSLSYLFPNATLEINEFIKPL